VVLLNVWGTWCVECRYEHPFLVELARSSAIPIYGLNLKDDRDSALHWLATLGDPYVESAVDADGGVAVDWGVYGAPETFLLSRDGTVLHKQIGVLTRELWQRDFLPLIEKECGSLPCPLVTGGEGG
jgi:cytochrome c biogenesis protein CcmG/thiol:disulfide interchange protein DsbE